MVSTFIDFWSQLNSLVDGFCSFETGYHVAQAGLTHCLAKGNLELLILSLHPKCLTTGTCHHAQLPFECYIFLFCKPKGETYGEDTCKPSLQGVAASFRWLLTLDTCCLCSMHKSIPQGTVTYYIFHDEMFPMLLFLCLFIFLGGGWSCKGKGQI